MARASLKAYVALEDAITHRLLKAWKTTSAPWYAAIAKLCRDQEWDKARQLVEHLDMTDVGTENREWFKYQLRAMAVFGANLVANGRPSWLQSLNFDDTLNRATTQLLLYLENNATTAVQQQAVQLIAQDEAASKVQKWDESQHPRDKDGRFAVTAEHGGYKVHLTGGGFIQVSPKISLTGEPTYWNVAGNAKRYATSEEALAAAQEKAAILRPPPPPAFVSNTAEEAEKVIADAKAAGQKILFHSGTAAEAADLATGITPQMGAWVQEVLSGATDDEEAIQQIQDDEHNAVAYFSEVPDWVSSKASREFEDKFPGNLTADDLLTHGHLSIVVADPEDESFKTSDENQNVYHPWTEKPVHEELPFGVEPGDIYTHEAVVPDINLTGRELLRFLNRNYPKANLMEGDLKAYKKESQPKRFVTSFVSFDHQGDAQLQMIASLHASRLSTWGFTAEAEVRGVTRYKLRAVIDGRTSVFCEEVANGREFEVADARKKVVEALSVTDPNDLKAVHPWPKQNEKAIDSFKAMSDDELREAGYFVPPFHPRCRTICTLVSQDVVIEPVTAPAQVDAATQRVTPETFEELGINATAKDLEHWNAYVGTSPVQLLESISQLPPTDIIDGSLGKNAIQFLEEGGIGFKARGVMKDVRYATGTVLDPFTGSYFLSEADFYTGSAAEQVKFFKALLKNVVDTTEMLPVTSSVVLQVAAGDAFGYLRLGFLPSSGVWQNTREYLSQALFSEGGSLQHVADALTSEQLTLVQQLLLDLDEHSAGTLADLEITVEGKKLGEWLFDSSAGTFTLDVADPLTVEKAQAYL